MISERQRIEKDLVTSGNASVYGVPLFRGACADGSGKNGDHDCIHRIPFCSLASDRIRKVSFPFSKMNTSNFCVVKGHCANLCTLARS